MTQGLRRGSSWITALATLGPVGKCPIAPGTAGTLVGFAAYFFLCDARILLDYVYWMTCLALPLLAVPICHAAEKSLGREDPSEIVLDEFAVIPLCFMGTLIPSQISSMDAAPLLAWLAAGFVLFRFFDVCKPLGIRASQRLSNGWGVVLDDVLAAVCACGCLNLGWRWFGWGA